MWTHAFQAILGTYGYFAVFVFVLIETSGIPFPGETMLVLAGAFAGSTHKLTIYWVIIAAIVGAIIGDNIGFWVGRWGGMRLLKRYGHVVHVQEGDLKIGLYLFDRYGSAIVFFARWIPLLRMWGALMAGSMRFDWKRFLLFNALGGIAWATFYGTMAYFFGDLLRRVETTSFFAALGLAVFLLALFFFIERRKHEEWKQKAQAAFPDPL